MIPGIFITMNNKTLNGYKEVFQIIKNYILDIINNKIERIKWKAFTTDYALYTAFSDVFNFINPLKHVGCFFHYLSNIRKYLQQNGFTDINHEQDYDYIIKESYKLPLIKNINLNIDKEIDKITEKKRI